MVDKTTIDRSIDEALGKQKIGDLHKEQKENLGAHKEEILEAVEAVEEHGKTNKLLNILQVAEIAANVGRDKLVRDEAAETKKSRDRVIKHNRGAVKSRSRIEGGIKDIKDMLGGDEPRELQSEQLTKDLKTLVSGGGTGFTANQIDANNIMASFATQMQSPGQLEKFANMMEDPDVNKDDKNALLSALNKISDVGSKNKELTQEKRDDLYKAGKAFGLDIDTTSNVGPFKIAEGKEKAIKVGEELGIVQSDLKGALKDIRNKAQEGRLTKPGAKTRTGVDIETIPEKNNEVLVDIYELLEKWYNQFTDQGGGGGGTNILPVRPRVSTTNTGGGVKPSSVKPTGGPKGGFATKAQAGPGAVKAKSGRWYSPTSTQGQAIINRSGPTAPGGKVPTAPPGGRVERLANTLSNSKVVKFGGLALSAGLETYDTMQDIEVANERAELGEKDEAFLATSDEETTLGALTDEGHNVTKEKAWEVAEGGTKVATGSVGAYGGAIAGAKLGAMIGTIGGPVGVAAGGIIGGVVGAGVGYLAGSSVGESVSGVAKAWSDDDLEAAQESGLYNWEGWGHSILDKSKLKDAPAAQLQAIIRHDDLSEDDKNAVLEELHRQGGSTSISADIEHAKSLEQGGPITDLEGVTTETGAAIDNTQQALEEATETSNNVSIDATDRSVSNTTIEKGEAFLVTGPTTKQDGASWLGQYAASS